MFKAKSSDYRLYALSVVIAFLAACVSSRPVRQPTTSSTPPTVVLPDDFPSEPPRPEPPCSDCQPPFPSSEYVRDIFFDTDRASIRESESLSLISDAHVLIKWHTVHPERRYVIEGHCDERGTAQYNLALGERRAAMVRDYLVSQGVDPTLLTIVSFGKKRPFAPGHDEAAWSKNRRAHFVVRH
jgi:peptidoglycan-associated lipoprotein